MIFQSRSPFISLGMVPFLSPSDNILTQEKVRQGIPPGKARRQAVTDVGGVEQVKESVWSAKAGGPLVDLWRDLQFGVRLVRKHPGFAVRQLSRWRSVSVRTLQFSAL